MKYEFKGTPAPWSLPDNWNIPQAVPPSEGHAGFESRSAYITDANNDVLANVMAYETEGFVKKDAYEANAHLIVASPLLLSALIKAVEYEEGVAAYEAERNETTGHFYPAWYHEAKAAIESALNLSPVNTQP